MLVKELRKELAKMPGEMGVYIPDGTGVMSVKHVFRMNLVGVEQFAEITIFGGDPHTPDMEDSLIERRTGFHNREELIEAYLKLKGKDDV
ncbi:hypothetical protein P10VF_106 [Rhizobium phage vB_RleM_P10VF]|uniref:Uncharacterized protein n=2 Tax=Innesvirus TaxID=3044739 RepID=A0A076YNF1_9CAUD|nr:hypothetical protein P10VF_106 [Rhizobium phage vB_RleM_P10VF]YP_010662291.1 hypothetical protein PP938_gp141 [Rhizobium phage AF3]AIK68319.1 hypothetical protein P10VF_106 [Rhizobium phage vB_RleM_P10VF]QNH71534.1 hypothetical protein AF3_141 [Rhizobium phage AF3]